MSRFRRQAFLMFPRAPNVTLTKVKAKVKDQKCYQV